MRISKKIVWLGALLASTAAAQMSQYPSPMVENTRAHLRLEKQVAAGQRIKLSGGSLFIPAALANKDKVCLFIHFHGADWIGELAASDNDVAVLSVNLGGGSSRYARPFLENPRRLEEWQREVETESGKQISELHLSAWSAGYGAIREILKRPANHANVHSVILLDGLHTDYTTGKPGPVESELVTDGLQVFLDWARLAAARQKQMLITHSEIFPGTFASTTETADYLVSELSFNRMAVLKWGPMQTQQLSEVRAGNLLVLGFAGNSAPDHVDHLHSIRSFWKMMIADKNKK
ncbi:MAG: hypothetical protein KDA87_10995 [Planctomycetales bacterium]|nr:hypothetical protein [Planctomycetales bacterium]